MDFIILVVVCGLFLAGAAFISLTCKLIPRRGDRTAIWYFYRVEVLIVGFALVPAYVGGTVYLVALLALGFRVQYEWFKLWCCRAFGVGQCVSYAITASVAAMPLIWQPGMTLAGAGIALTGLTLALTLRPGAARRAAGGVTAALLPGVLVACLLHLRGAPQGFAVVFLVYAVAETNDTCAFLAGRIFGKTALFPRLSPRKTLEGFLAGAASALVLAVALDFLLFEAPLAVFLPRALTVLGAALAGDLLASHAKRQCQEKDFPLLVAGHGGATDIYDSTLLAALALFVYDSLVG